MGTINQLYAGITTECVIIEPGSNKTLVYEKHEKLKKVNRQSNRLLSLHCLT